MVKSKGRIRTQISYSVHMGNCRAERRAKLSNDLQQSGAPQQGCRVRSKGRGWVRLDLREAWTGRVQASPPALWDQLDFVSLCTSVSSFPFIHFVILLACGPVLVPPVQHYRLDPSSTVGIKDLLAQLGSRVHCWSNWLFQGKVLGGGDK